MSFGSASRWMRGWQCVAVLSVFAFAWRHMDMLGDAFWYIATGRYVLEHRAFPQDELFSYAGVRGPWFVNMPISEPLFAWTMDHLGVWALLGMSTVAFGVALLLFWLPHAKGAYARLLTWPVVLFAIYVQRDDLSVRSQSIADIAIAVLFLWMFRIRDGGRVPPWAPVVLSALWMNVHPSVLIGVLVPTGFAVGCAFGSPDDRRCARPLLLVAGGVTLGTFVNPYGYRLVFEFVRFMTAESTIAIDLFRSPDFLRPDVALALGLGGALMAASFRGVSRKAGLPEACVMLAMIAATCVSRRYVEILMAWEIVVLGRLLEGVTVQSVVPSRKWTVPLAAAALALTVLSVCPSKDPWQNVPVEAAQFIEDHKLPDNVMNMLHWGGYLDYAWGGRRRIFMDGRTTQFENGVLTDHGKLAGVDPGSREVLDVYLVNTVLWERGSRLDYALAHDPDWAEVFRKGIAVVYVRKKLMP